MKEIIPKVMPSLVEGYVTVPVPDDTDTHLCDGCAFDSEDGQTDECLEVVCCDGVIFRKIN